jgi:hypothetical protein
VLMCKDVGRSPDVRFELVRRNVKTWCDSTKQSVSLEGGHSHNQIKLSVDLPWNRGMENELMQKRGESGCAYVTAIFTVTFFPVN